MNHMQKVEKFFWDNLENDELQVNDNNYEILNQAIRLMDLDDENIANREIESDPTLLRLFGIQDSIETINVIEENNSESVSPQDGNLTDNDSDDSDQTKENFRMDKQGFSEETSTQGANSRKRKGNFYPFNDGKNTVSVFGNNILDIDCKPNRKELIDKWAQEISLIIQTNKEAYEDPKTVLLLIEHKTTGIVNNFIKNTNWTPRLSSTDTLEDVINALYTIFLGIDLSGNKEKEQERIRNRAVHRLTNMTLCDICYLDDFFCDYEKNLYILKDQNLYKKYILDYLLKIPIVGEKAHNRFLIESSSTAEFSLGFAQRIIKEEISEVCDLSRTQRRLKKFSKKCCKSIQEPSLEYGCKPTRKKIRKQKQKYASKYRFKRKRKPFRPGKFVRKKHDTNKQKFCPKGKKNCRCWICNEEGHYANECPNRKKHGHKTNMLEQVYSLGFIPIEDPYEDTLDVYLIEEIDSSTESDDFTSSSESD